MAELTSMRNIGKEMARKLTAVGIDCPETLRELGAKEAFFRLKVRYPEVCLVHLYALEGAVCDVAYNCLTEAQKKECRALSDSLKQPAAVNGKKRRQEEL